MTGPCGTSITFQAMTGEPRPAATLSWMAKPSSKSLGRLSPVSAMRVPSSRAATRRAAMANWRSSGLGMGALGSLVGGGNPHVSARYTALPHRRAMTLRPGRLSDISAENSKLCNASWQKTGKDNRAQARLPKGFGDAAQRTCARRRMLETIREVYECYGFEPLETPAIEYTEALGKFLPDQDRPNAGVFSFQDEDEQWLSLRYDLTAPLARYVAEGLKEQSSPLPFRRYAVGPVWRNEKPGPGRFRQFTQFDADTVGTDNIAADAEICMLAADTLEALGISRGQVCDQGQ